MCDKKCCCISEKVSLCAANPCANGGTCKDLEDEGRFECTCPSGFGCVDCTCPVGKYLFKSFFPLKVVNVDHGDCFHLKHHLLANQGNESVPLDDMNLKLRSR